VFIRRQNTGGRLVLKEENGHFSTLDVRRKDEYIYKEL
jgi:hypothetical protein